MKAVVLSEPGPAENLHVAEVAEPVLGSSGVLIQVAYAGVNHGDISRRERGISPAGPPPYILGFEGVGRILAVGAEVKGRHVGQRVAFLAKSGAYAEIVSVAANQVFSMPEEIQDGIAAGSVCVGLTALSLARLAEVRAGQAVLVHAGAGGVGSTLIQVCKNRSAKVIATVGSSQKAEFALKCGADVVVPYRDADLATEVQKITRGVGVDTIFDCVGRTVAEANFGCLRQRGTVVYYGSASGHAQFPGDKILHKEARVIGFVIFNVFGQPAWDDRVEELTAGLRSGAIQIEVTELPMARAADAHRLLERRTVNGKIVLRIKDPA